ncbi:MAG: hypothetical protein AB8B96_07415 [Lysobacterales bacterium]
MNGASSNRRVYRGARLIDPTQSLDQKADLWVADELIVAVGTAPDGADEFESVDVSDCWISAGLIDLSARVLGNPETELKAASAGGISQLLCPPDAHFIPDTPSEVRDRLNQLSICDTRVHLLGALTRHQAGEQLTDQAALRAAGCVGLSDGGRSIADTRVLRSAMAYAASLGITLFLQPQDRDLADGCAHDGAIATRLGLPAIPAVAETVDMARILALAADTGARIHLTRVSSAAGVTMLEKAKADGLAVTADVAVHQLFLTEQDLVGFNAQCHVHPPLRSTGDREALIRAVASGTIDAICSDHTPLPDDAKLAPFADSEAGISGLETLLPLGLRLVEDDRITLSQLIERTVIGPANALGLDPIGLVPGLPIHELIAFAPVKSWRPTDQHWQSFGHNTPLSNWQFDGRASALSPK